MSDTERENRIRELLGMLRTFEGGLDAITERQNYREMDVLVPVAEAYTKAISELERRLRETAERNDTRNAQRAGEGGE